MNDATPAGLSEREVEDLYAALDDEYRAVAIYRQVLADFGEVLPFANIVESEGRHIEALVSILTKYGLDVPRNPHEGSVPRFDSVAAACAAGVEAEIENAALYDRLLAGTARADILTVYRNLQQASQQNHLPAFRRCVERDGREPGGGAPGRGRGPGRRWRGGRG